MFTKLFRLTAIVSVLALAFLVTVTTPTSRAVAASTLSMLGADVSSLQRAEDLG